jgi:hypothetical protein
MPVWLSVMSLRFCAQTVGKPVTAVEAAIAAPPLRTERLESFLPISFFHVHFLLFPFAAAWMLPIALFDFS